MSNQHLSVKPLPADVLAALHAKTKSGVSQAALAKLLNVSAATVSNALNGKFRGNADTFSKRVRGLLLQQTVMCPVLQQISTKDCQDKQRLPFAATNPTRLALHRACKTCPHRNQGD